MRGRFDRALPIAGFAALIYVPLLFTAPGVVVADTKAYLYLDPGRLLSRAASMWDAHVALGTVTHQNIGYLWPMGPWFWALDRLGFPDWVAQRLWIGSIMFVAGLGVRYLLRTLGWRGHGIAVAMVTYALTPYLLTLAARLSVILLPYAALPWLLALTIMAVRSGGWRYPAVFALVVATAGSTNATALLLVGVAPALWLIYDVGRRAIRPLPALGVVGRIGVLTVAANLWWIAGLSVQATNGLDVLQYSETAETVASGSLAHEVLRGLGYWFFYGDDRLGPWIEPGVQYTQRLWLLIISFLVPIADLAGGAMARWRHRAYFVVLLVGGVAISVGGYPWADPPLFGALVKALLLTDAGLAMRSLPRAVPLVVLSLAVLLGAGLTAVITRRPSFTWPLTVALVALVVAAFPPLWQRAMVPQNLRRPEAIPDYWTEAGAHLDRTDDGTRVLEIPGADFASYRWGNTVEPVSPGLTDRPLVFRELIPYGSPASTDLLIAFDARLQAHVAEPESFAALARLLRSGQLLVRSDLQFERFNTPRPRELWDLLERAPGLGSPVEFGRDQPNLGIALAPMEDELALTIDPSVPDPPAVAVIPVDDALPVVAAQPAASPVVVAADGAGLVDAATAGLLDGRELILYSAAIDDQQLQATLDDGAALVVTDTNRAQGERWNSVRYNRGYTEPAGLQPLATDLRDNRLPVLPGADTDAFTVVEHRGGLTADATAYGNPVEYSPEDRPANAVDGDPTTAWRTGAFSPVVGERLVLTFDEPVTASELTLLQPVAGNVNRWVTEVRLRFDDEATIDLGLDESSRVQPGQRVEFPERTFRRLELEIRADTFGEWFHYLGVSSTGFAEVTIGDLGLHIDEVVRLPVDLLDRAGSSSIDHPLAIVLSRLRASPTEVVRADEELSIVRALTIPQPRSFRLEGTARLSPQVADDVVDRLIGLPDDVVVTSSSRLPDLAFRGRAAVDGDPSTSWSPAFGPQTGQWIEVATATAGPITIDRLPMTLVADGRHSVPTVIGVEADGVRVASLDVPSIADADDADEEGAVIPIGLDLDQPVTATRFRFFIEAVREVTTTDWYSRGPVSMPVGIAELGLPGVTRAEAGARFDSGCRSDLVAIDGRPVPVVVRGPVEDAIAGRPLAVTTCDADVDLGAGEVVLRAAQGRSTGIDLDRLVLRSAAGGAASTAAGPVRDEAVATLPPPDRRRADDVPSVDVVTDTSSRVTIEISGADPGGPFWMTLGQSHNDGWRATIDGEDLGDPVLVDGFANGWLVDPPSGSFTIDMRFAPQQRVWIALVVSGLAVVVCLALVFVSPRRRDAAVADESPKAFSWADILNYPGPVPSWGRTAGVAALLGVVGLALVSPAVGLAMAAVGGAGMRWSRVRPAVLAAAPGSLLGALAYVLVWQWGHEIPAGFDWPAQFGRAHPFGWLAVLLLLADIVIAQTRSVAPAVRKPHPEGDETATARSVAPAVRKPHQEGDKAEAG